jgi:hypothetical protein
MRHDISLKLIIAIVAGACLALHCAGLGPFAGTVTQSGNGMVSGAVVDSGRPVADARVLLIPAQYDPNSGALLPDSLTGTTDESGAFRIIAPNSMAYNVEVENTSGKNALRFNVAFSDRDTQNIGLLSLAIPGRLCVIVPVTAGLDMPYVYIPGTTFFSPVHGDTAVIGNVPAGSIPTVMYRPSRTGTGGRVIRTDVVVTSGMTTTIADYSMWTGSQRLSLNTTASGAAIAGNVTDFPVLVRLTSSNFDFGRALPGGADLRFTKGNGVPLSFEIERWDAARQAAEIWVKLDTVYVNDSSRFFVMYWGNPGAVDASSGETVFDTADGFSGVWHLAGAGNATANDATAHHYIGTPSDTAPQATAGVIGTALQFDGKSTGIAMKNTAASRLNFPRPGTYTISAWVLADSVVDEDEFITGKGFDQYALRIKGSQSIPANMFALHERVGAPVYGTEMRYAPAVVRQWKYLVGIRDTAGSRLYIDGQCVDSTGTIINGGGNPADTVNFSIGRCAAFFVSSTNPNDYLPFKGKVDEVRIASVRFSADWIRLSYMNQKEQDALIKFAK